MIQQAQDLELPELGTSKLILSIFRQLKKTKTTSCGACKVMRKELKAKVTRLKNKLATN